MMILGRIAIGAAYCYRWSTVVCLSVCLSGIVLSLAKTAEQIEMPLGLWTRVGQRKHVLGGGAHWRHLAKTTEPSTCDSNATLNVKLL